MRSSRTCFVIAMSWELGALMETVGIHYEKPKLSRGASLQAPSSKLLAMRKQVRAFSLSDYLKKVLAFLGRSGYNNWHMAG